MLPGANSFGEKIKRAADKEKYIVNMNVKKIFQKTGLKLGWSDSQLNPIQVVLE